MSDDNVTPIRPAKSNPDGAKRKKRPVRKIQGPMSGAKAITAEQRTAEAIRMRLANWPLKRIADELGYADESGAWRAIMRGLAAELPEATRDELRRIEIAKLNALEAAHANGAHGAYLGDDAEGKPIHAYPDEKSSTIVLRCITQRSKLLGLEAPQQVSLTVRDGESVEVEILQALPPNVLAAALALRNEMTSLAAMRAGAIEAAPVEPVPV